MAKTRFPSKIISPVHQSVFERPRLLDLLAENQHRPLVWVHGSPGAGKTTLVSSWLKQQQARFLWYRMDSGINVSADLFYFLSLSVQRNYPRKRINLPVFTAEYANDVKAFAVVFFRKLFTVLEKESAIVFDNCQEIENDPDFFLILQIALNDIPEGFQIICISRNRPANIFSRLSLTGELLDINPEQLRFTDTESTAFLGWLNPKIDAQTSATLQVKAKGWAVALVLLSQKNTNDTQAQIPEVHEQVDVFGFLLAEILADFDKAALQFLTETAVFNQFTVTMAITLTNYHNAQAFLDDLGNKNFLIDRTDEPHPVYCYHPILQDLLNNQNKRLLTDKQLNELSRRAINILIEEKKIEEVLPFYLQLQDWSGLKPLLLEYSEDLINSGRHHAVITWVEHLPNELLECDPWLLYWYAAAIKPHDPIRSAQLLDNCYQQFLTTADRLGLYSTWQLAVEAITFSLDDFSQLDIWFRRFDALREGHPNCPSFELKIKFSVTALQALACYNPQHPWFNKLLKISEYGFRIVPIKLLQQLICSQLGNYYSLAYEIAKLQVLKPYLLANINDDSLPALPRILNVYLIACLNVYHGDGDRGLTYLVKGLNISEQSAIPLFKPLLKLHLVACHISRGDLVSAQNCLDNALSTISSKSRLVNSLFHYYSAWICALKGQLTMALEENEQSLLLCELINHDYGIVCCLGLKARLLAETAQWEIAEQVLLSLANTHQQSPSKFRQLEYHLSDAWLGLLSNNQDRALLGIKQFLSLVNHEQIRFFIGWQPNVITPLCILAIEHNIEVEFALSMMQVNGLCPPPPQHLEQWPWPVRIYCFNHLQIELNGKLLKQDGKSQKKVIELLLTIITLGSQDVQSEKVCDWLWPDSDGDLAQQTLNTALFRLRKLIGKSAVLVNDGRISLNPNCCWIDVLAFDTTLNELDDVLLHNTDDALLVKLSNRLLHVYQGPFLKHIDSAMVIVKQDQLQNKIIRLLNRLTLYHEKRQEHSRICWLLEQGLERIPHLETDYQGLISYHQQIANAL